MNSSDELREQYVILVTVFALVYKNFSRCFDSHKLLVRWEIGIAYDEYIFAVYGYRQAFGLDLRSAIIRNGLFIFKARAEQWYAIEIRGAFVAKSIVRFLYITVHARFYWHLCLYFRPL